MVAKPSYAELESRIHDLENECERSGRLFFIKVDFMTKMASGETYDRLKMMDLDVKVLLSSGYSMSGEATEILKRGCNGFIQKPFRLVALSQKIRSVIEE